MVDINQILKENELLKEQNKKLTEERDFYKSKCITALKQLKAVMEERDELKNNVQTPRGASKSGF